jgi:hypothetical protein
MITFQISAKYFWGYRTKLDVEKCESLKEIIENVIENCRDFFKENNLLSLVDLLQNTSKNYHIHEYNLDKLKLLNKLDAEEIIYVCDHCH